MQKNYLVMIFLFVIILTVSTTTTALKSNHLTTSNRTQVVQKVSKTYIQNSVNIIFIVLIIMFVFMYLYRELQQFHLLHVMDPLKMNLSIA